MKDCDGNRKEEEGIDNHLLQVGTFRFVTGAKFIFRKSKKDLNIGDVFQGCYEISPDFNLSDLGDMYPGFFEEIAAQVGSLTVGEYLGDIHNDSSKILTFNKSRLRVLSNDLTESDRIFITGKVTDIQEKYISFAFFGSDESGKDLFQGEIVGNIMPVKLIKRMNRNKSKVTSI
ncbi:MAG: hypothetical protein PHS92_01880 [Candidatus Gracilibacteria bacterium]|nr:hypothetical protein [Candidatus Gracilibacteria bacterium]